MTEVTNSPFAPDGSFAKGTAVSVTFPWPYHGDVGGWTCWQCGGWVPNGVTHFCPTTFSPPPYKPVPEVTGVDPFAPGGPLDRIADALQRIAQALEEKSGV